MHKMINKLDTLQTKFYLETEYPVALESYDHIYPCGTIRDNYRNQLFNQKLYRFPGAVLDLGCAGGGFVKNCLEDGVMAVGLEGSDLSLKMKRAEWVTIPDNLFTCDISKPFTLHTGNHIPFSFGIITAWEVLEHILKADLPVLFANISHHLNPKGFLITSIANFPSPVHRHEVIDLHRTQEDENWWLKELHKAGFKRNKTIENYFGQDWVRNLRGGYHLVLNKI